MFLTITLLFTFYSSNSSSSQDIVPPSNSLSWSTDDNSVYTFTNNTGADNSTYAWQILDETGNSIYKTKYTESNMFTYEFADETPLIIKSFCRTPNEQNEEDYIQTSSKISSLEVMDLPKYQVSVIKPSEEIVNLISDITLYKKDDLSNRK